VFRRRAGGQRSRAGGRSCKVRLVASVLSYLREKHLETWIGGYARHLIASRKDRRAAGPRHLLFCYCDHWEPLWNQVTDDVASDRVRTWAERYPKLADGFRDSEGRKPKHSFFFPGEQYRPAWLDTLAGFAREGIGEVELHLHHDGDTRPKLKADLERYLGEIASHGHFARDAGGRVRYAFIHGNWCLANARKDGTYCGVDDEIPLLFETGCYADFTFPAAPNESQPNIVNQIYWPVGDLARRRAYEQGERARVGEVKRDRILMIEGPLAVATRRAKIPFWFENSAITAKEPGTERRARTWVEQNIHVEGRPEWVFVKVHTHGAPEREAAGVLGDGGLSLHRALTGRYNDGREWLLHYVSAREMFNIAVAAMEGREGNPAAYRDHVFAPPPAARA
jgi:hypothetical protein